MAYKSGWISIVEFQTGQEVSTKFDNAFTNIDLGLAAVTQIEEGLTSLGLRVDEVESAIATLNSRVAALEAATTPIYEFDKKIDVNLPITWTDLGTVNIASHPAGIYQYLVSFTFVLDSINSSGEFRYSIDGGSTWFEFSIEPKDINNTQPYTHVFPYEATEDEGLSLMLQGQKQDAGDTLIVQFSDVAIEKKVSL